MEEVLVGDPGEDQRCDCEVETTDPQRDDAESGGHQRGDARGQHQADREGDVPAAREQSGGERADADESGMSQGDLADPADQQHQ